jgi:triosephosphate isomerase (TIM)
MKKPIVVANWKLNPPTIKDARVLFGATKKALRSIRTAADVVLCPPLSYVGLLAKGERSVVFGAQDVSSDARGAFTGEVSAESLRSIGTQYVIVGHSERRARGESDTMVSKKVRAALEEKLTPIVCVGETVRDEHGSHLAELSAELRNSLSEVVRNELSRLIIAYEPVWAIGKSADDALDAHGLHETVIFIRKILTDIFDRESAAKVRIIYGGSVEPANAQPLIQESGVSGFLVGHASLDARSFSAIVKACAVSKK